MVFGLPYGRKFSELFKVCGLGDGYKAAKTQETQISEDFTKRRLQKALRKPLGAILGPSRPGARPSRPGAAGGRQGAAGGLGEGAKTLLKNLLEKPFWKTSLKLLGAVLGGLGRPWGRLKRGKHIYIRWFLGLLGGGSFQTFQSLRPWGRLQSS